MADELTRETLVTFCDGAAGSVDETNSAPTTIYRIVRNLSVERIRHQRCWQIEEPTIALPCGCALADVVSKDEQLRTHVLTMLESLTPEQVELLRLVFIEGRPPSEIATRQGLPIAIVKSRMRQCYRHVRKNLDDRKRQTELDVAGKSAGPILRST